MECWHDGYPLGDGRIATTFEVYTEFSKEMQNTTTTNNNNIFIHKIRSDDSLHMPDDLHYIHTHSIISFFHAR